MNSAKLAGCGKLIAAGRDCRHLMSGKCCELARPAQDHLDSRIAVVNASGMKPPSHPGRTLGFAFVSLVLLSLANPLLEKCPTYSVEIHRRIECSFKPEYRALVTLIPSINAKHLGTRPGLG